MNPQQAPHDPASLPRRYFHLDSEFRDEFKLLLQQAPPGHLDLLDSSGALFGLAEAETVSLLQTWLAAPATTLRIATFEEAHLLGGAPAFQHLRSLRHPQMEWRIIPSARQGQIQQAFALFGERLVKKPVREAFHGFSDRDASDARAQLDYFEQIWQICEPAPAHHPLGL